MTMASEAAKEHSENLIKHAPDRPTKGYLCAKVEAAYDAGAAAVMERLERVCRTAENLRCECVGEVRCQSHHMMDEVLRRMRETNNGK